MTMTKAEFDRELNELSKYALTKEMVDSAWLYNDKNIEILETSDFIDDISSTPAKLAEYIKEGNLELASRFVRIFRGGYYDIKEGDHLTDLVSDKEVKDFIQYELDYTPVEDYEKTLHDLKIV